MSTLTQRSKSATLFEESCRYIPSGVNSPVRSFPGMEQTPLVVESGYGDEIVDLDGKRYIDFCNSWGALILGHAHPLVVEAAQQRMAKGSTFGAATAVEKEIAAKVVGMVPSIEKVRFVSSGTEATMSALRVARGFTGRTRFVKFTGHYHGHADPFLVQAGSGCVGSAASAGVPDEVVKETLLLPYNDIDAVREVLSEHEVAAVILEPIAANMGVVPPKPGFLQQLREETRKVGALLIFDEVITGFRVAKGGAQALYGVKPDLTCLGKIVGGGFPAAAFGGRAEIMDCLAPAGPVYQAGTLSGNPVAMGAGLQTLNLLERPDFYTELEKKTAFLVDPIQEQIEKRDLNACIQSVPGMFTLFFGARSVSSFASAKQLDLPRFQAFFTHLFDQGIYFSPSQFEANFLSAAHTYPHLERVRNAILDFLS